MYKNKGNNNSNNICGIKISELRKKMIPKTSQRMIAEKLQLIGLDFDKNAIQRIESGKRFVTDIELVGFCKIFNVSADELLKNE
ncbi:MAG: helix-turn-helix transcriptional regulator [Oscillospiraceae bacterium]